MRVLVLVSVLLSLGLGGCHTLSAGSGGVALSEPAMSADAALAEGGTGSGAEIQSGTLTAGSFDDNAEIEAYRTFVKSLGQHQVYGPLASRLTGRRIVLTVTDDAGKTIGNARVKVADRMYVSRTDGRVVVLTSFDGVPADEPIPVTVRVPGSADQTTATVPVDADALTIVVRGVQAALPRTLDLTLVIDVTGSMGDELEYLKKEIKSIANTVHRRFPDVEQRFALVVYRDEDDDFVVSSHDFMPEIGEFQEALASYTAGGGGDYPEAMDAALFQAKSLEWRGGNTASVLFLVADAPPHDEHAEEMLLRMDDLRKRGVVIYPVAASGVAEECELVMRTAALVTGAKYLFLTDDSGVGNPHAEPHIPYYDVERLDRLMIRMIESELAGKEIAADPEKIIRRVDHREEQ